MTEPSAWDVPSDRPVRHSTIVLLAGYATFGMIAAITQHRMDLATDFPRIPALPAFARPPRARRSTVW